jgi:hypothetical protein
LPNKGDLCTLPTFASSSMAKSVQSAGFRLTKSDLCEAV